MKKKLVALLIAIAILISIASPALAEGDYAHQAHGSHGLGNVNQNFNGIEEPPPWDLPPGQNP